MYFTSRCIEIQNVGYNKIIQWMISTGYTDKVVINMYTYFNKCFFKIEASIKSCARKVL